jgi:hypothetical protein
MKKILTLKSERLSMMRAILRTTSAVACSQSWRRYPSARKTLLICEKLTKRIIEMKTAQQQWHEELLHNEEGILEMHLKF